MSVRVERVRFASEGGVECAGLFYLPAQRDTEKPLPAVVMAHGFSLVKEAYLPQYAERFAEEGMAVLLFDYRFFGESGGEPRQQLIPAEQIKDYRNAITWVSQRPEVDANRIGIWGTSYSGGHVLHIAAIDRRVKAVVSQVPTINGWRGLERKIGPEKMKTFINNLIDYRVSRYNGGEQRYLAVVSNTGEPAAQPSPEAFAWFTHMGKEVAPTWENRITLESMEHYVEYDPAGLIDIISPTPLLMIVAVADKVTPPDLAIEAFETRAREPKELVKIEGGHFDVYQGPLFSAAADPAAAWFAKHLLPAQS